MLTHLASFGIWAPVVERKPTVLVVDDNSADRELIARMLAPRYDVLEAPDVKSGLQLCRRSRPDCVLLDHYLPGRSGLEGIGKFVERGAIVIMMTGEGSDELAAEAFKRGARDYISKAAMTTVVLSRMIRREIERRRLETEELRLQQELRLAQKLEAIGQLAAGIAHEINTPSQYVSDNITFLAEGFAELRPVLLALAEVRSDAARHDATQLAKLAAAADLDYLLKEVPEAIEQAAAGIAQIKKIVLAMKEFSHPANDMTAIDFNHTVANTVTVARNEWKYVADVELDLASDLPQVQCFPSEINQVVLNLIVNAAHAIADAGGERGKITVRTRRDGSHVALTVADTGCGIPEAIRDRIFDPFFTTKAVGKGTGQGLAIAHRVVVEHHRGTIALESEVGRGTSFVIRLPIECAADAEPDTTLRGTA